MIAVFFSVFLCLPVAVALGVSAAAFVYDRKFLLAAGSAALAVGFVILGSAALAVL